MRGIHPTHPRWLDGSRIYKIDGSRCAAWSSHGVVEDRKGERAYRHSASVAGPWDVSGQSGSPGLCMPLAPED